MPLNFSAAHSSRVTKRQPGKNPLLRRSSSSPFTSFNQRKPVQRSRSKPEIVDSDEDDDFFGDRLDDVGLVNSLTTDLSLRDVAQFIRYVHTHMFDAIPESGGFNSTRIAEILNFRKSLPQTVTLAHVHAMTKSPTSTEREIADLTKAGIIRKIVIPGRGTGGSSVAEGLVLYQDLERILRETSGLDGSMIEKFLDCLRAKPLALALPRSDFTALEATALMRAGFLTSASQSLSSANVFSRPDATSSASMTSLFSISRAASGSMAAIGGEGAIHAVGGSGNSKGIRRSSSQYSTHWEQDSQQTPEHGDKLQLALPSTGPYLRLLTAARSHFMSLLLKSKFKEMPLYLLKERWDGGISADDPAAKAKKYRGEFAGILPNRTRKWKQFYGLQFEWVLAECLGAGLIELFETGSVGRAVRAI